MHASAGPGSTNYRPLHMALNLKVHVGSAATTTHATTTNRLHTPISVHYDEVYEGRQPISQLNLCLHYWKIIKKYNLKLFK